MDSDKYLIIGGTGFIGSYIANSLIKQNKEVIVIARSRENDWRLEYPESCRIEYLDITDYKRLKDIIDEVRPEYIIHLSAYVNAERDFKYIEGMLQNNLLGTFNILKALSDHPYKMLINTGTCEEYGNGLAPFNEQQRERPVSPYSLSKVASTHLCEMANKIYGMPVITVRPFLTYGPKQVSKMLIPWLIYSGIMDKKVPLTKGEQTRDFIYVQDVADAYIRLTSSEICTLPPVINIGSGQEVKIKEVVSQIQHYFPGGNFHHGALDYRIGETMSFYAQTNLLNRFIAPPHITSLKDGIDRTIQWWLENKAIWSKYMHRFG